MGLLALAQSRRGRAHLCSTLLALLAVLSIFTPALPGSLELSTSEQALKAAFVFNFCKFTEWPERALRAKKEFIICSLGHSSLDAELSRLNGKSVGGRTVVFRRVSSVEECRHCQALFISRSQQARLEGILDALRETPVLTIADREDFCRRGGMLTLEQEGDRLVFDVNFHELQRAGLKANPRMLKLARRIYGRPD